MKPHVLPGRSGLCRPWLQIDYGEEYGTTGSTLQAGPGRLRHILRLWVKMDGNYAEEEVKSRVIPPADDR